MQGVVNLAPTNDPVHAIQALGPKFEQWLNSFLEECRLEVLTKHCNTLLKQLPLGLQHVALSQSVELQVGSIVRLLGTEQQRHQDEGGDMVSD